MLLNVTALLAWRLDGTDGVVGSVVDLLFDDERWGARYLVVETGRWLESRQVLVPPGALRRDPGEFGSVHTTLTREQIRACPAVDTRLPVSRRDEIAHARHYGYAPYWNGTMLWGAAAYPPALVPLAVPEELLAEEQAREDEAAQQRAAAADDDRQSHLRSAREVIGYRVQTSDGDAGDVDDLAIDDQDWSIAYLNVDARRWWPGGRVLVRPSAVSAIRHEERCVALSLSREALRAQPPVD